MAEKDKVYLLDTNVLIHDPHSLQNFADARVVIPITVLEELDNFKGESSDRGRNAREVIRTLDQLRNKGPLREGVTLDNGGVVQIVFARHAVVHRDGTNAEDQVLSASTSGDNKILGIALALKEQGFNVQFISKDINARVKADVLGISAQDYLRGQVTTKDVYRGWIEVPVQSVQLKHDIPPELNELVDQGKLAPNQFVVLTARTNQYQYRVFRYLGEKKFKDVHAPELRWAVEPKNILQLMALDLLLDPTVQLVCLLGPAGTGKTFLALLAGLHQVLVQDMYAKLLVSRPVIPLGPDIGYLPGDIQEKLHIWMQPIYDNVDLLVHSAALNSSQYGAPAEPHEHQYSSDRSSGREERLSRRKRQAYQDRHEKPHGLRSLDDLVRSGKISLEAITYMRGRSIPYQYILIDEVQNLTPHEVKTLVSRVGQGSKIVLAGDPFQIDSPYLDFSSNGLVVSSTKLKGQSLFGTIFLESSERSELSRLAAELL